MKTDTALLLPSSSLPPLGDLDVCTQEHIVSVLASLAGIFCPLSTASNATLVTKSPSPPKLLRDTLSPPNVDSGYVSDANEEDEEHDAERRDPASIRTDAFERDCARRWVSGFVTRAETCAAFRCEDARQTAVDEAYVLIEALSVVVAEADDGEDDEEDIFRRDFSFDTATGPAVKVHLNDKLAGTRSEDPDDVGLQSWGASILFSRLLCQEPEAYGISRERLGTAPRIVELGAGTGLVSLALGALLPKIDMHDAKVVATDYHPAVLENLRANVDDNLAEHESVPIATCALDWSTPRLEGELAGKADMLLATDVIYSPQHAEWLRDCASAMLAPDALFWLVAAVRENGKFEGVSATVKTAFASEERPRDPSGKRLTILENVRMEKSKGIGRGDESWYEIFRIGWV